MFKLLFARHRMDWHWEIGVKLSIDFAVWALEQDGLHAPPFDQHSSGNGALTAAGLTAARWHEWLVALINEEHRFREALSSELNHRSLRTIVQDTPMGFQPALFFQQDDPLRDRLDTLWATYKRISNQRRAFERHVYPIGLPPREARRFWNEMESARGDMPPLDVMLVGYPARLVYPIPPATLILAPGREQFGFEGFRSIMLQSVSALRQ
jgi:hypothetical protein